MGRLHRLERDAAGGAIDLPLMLAASGEVGNNSFDHNLGQWRDVPGCWFEAQSTRNRYWVLIADRGQGIYSSLSRALPRLKGDEAAVRAAFEERISGRSPEKRGNGLKFVREVVAGATGGVCCRSGAGRVQYGDLGEECAKVVGSVVSGKVPGTVTLMAWRFRR